MQRQLYLVLFVMVAATAVVAVMRPNVAEELATLGRLGLPGLLGQAVAAPPQQKPADSSGGYVPGDPMFSAAPPVSWADAAPPKSPETAGESFASDSSGSSQVPSGYSPAQRPPINYPRPASRPVSAQSGTFGQGAAGQRPLDLRGLALSPTRFQPPAAAPRFNPPAAPRFNPPAAPRRYEPAAPTQQYAEAGANRTQDRLPPATVAAPSPGESFPAYPSTNRPFSTYPSTPTAPGMTNAVRTDAATSGARFQRARHDGIMPHIDSPTLSNANEADRTPVAIPMPARPDSARGYQDMTGSFDRSMTARSFDGAKVDEAAKSAPSKNWWDIDAIRAAEETRRRTAVNATARQDGIYREAFPSRGLERTMSPAPARPRTPSQQPAPSQFSGPARQSTPGAGAPPMSGSAEPAATGPTRSPVASRFERPWQSPRGEMPKVAPDPPPTALFENARILARVGSHIILAGEVMPLVNQVMEENKDKYPASVLEEQRELLIGKLLDQRIEMKLIFCDAQRSLPPEAITGIEKHLAKQFEEEEIPRRLEKAELGSRLELQQELEKIGSSLEREKRSFIERAVSQQWVYQEIGDEKEITHEDILDYYRQHAADFEHTARARWEQLTVRFSRHPDRREARTLIAQMGNDVMRGRPFADVAQEHSEGSTANDGGARDWTTQGSLRSEQLDRTLFGLPVGQLSPILEDEHGVHIVRVVEREDVNRTPFLEAQVEIKEKLRREHRKERMDLFTERLKDEIPVWTVFDDEVADRRSSESAEPPTR